MRKTICITGATGGLGSELTRKLNKKFRLILLYRNKDKLETLIGVLKIKDYVAIYCDAININSIKIACNELKKYEIDTIIHTAGILTNKSQINEENISYTYMANLVLPVYLSSQLKQVKNVVYISSLMHKYGKVIYNLDNPRPKFLSYADSKLNAMNLLSSLLDNIIFIDPFIVDTAMMDMNKVIDLLSKILVRPFVYDTETSVKRLVGIIKYNKYKRFNKKLVSAKKVKAVEIENNPQLLKEILDLF